MIETHGFTDEEADAYYALGCEACPRCGGYDVDVDVDTIVREAMFIYRTHECEGCGCVWEERYSVDKIIYVRG